MFSAAHMVLFMNFDLTVLRAVTRLSRKGRAADLEALNVRCGGELAEIRQAVRRLATLGLVTRDVDFVARPTLSGLALAVAVARAPRTRSRVRLRDESPVASPSVDAANAAPARRVARSAA